MWIRDARYEWEKISLLINVRVILFPFQICNKKCLLRFDISIMNCVPDLISSNVSMTPAATEATLFGRILPAAVSRGRFDQSRPTTRKKGCAECAAGPPCASWFPSVTRRDAARGVCRMRSARRNEIISVTGGRIPRINNSQLSRIDVFSKIT